MASSGIQVRDDVLSAFLSLKKDKNNKYVIFTFSDDQKEIIPFKLADKDATYEQFRSDLDSVGACYAIYDYKYQKGDTTHAKIFFISWCPEGTKIKQKMLIASTKDTLKKKLVGVGCELQATDADEISEEAFVQKLKDLKAF